MSESRLREKEREAIRLAIKKVAMISELYARKKEKKT